jgi:hypothetical protein
MKRVVASVFVLKIGDGAVQRPQDMPAIGELSHAFNRVVQNVIASEHDGMGVAQLETCPTRAEIDDFVRHRLPPHLAFVS